MLAFQADKSVDVKKFVVGFMEEACKVDNEVLFKVIGNLNLLLQDENVNVQKRVILSMTHLFRIALQWMVKSKAVSELMTQTWHYICKMKDSILTMLDADNDGVRTHAVKFVESLVITLSERQPDSDIPKKNEKDISLDQIPEEHRHIEFKKMEKEGNKAFETLLEFQASAHISSVNLITVMGALTTIAKQRPQFFIKVVQGFESLHVNLPPTLAKSQVSSVRKNLKVQLLQLLKHQASFDSRLQITTLLTDLGATNAEVMKAMPKTDERKRKTEDMDALSSVEKKQKTESLVPQPVEDDDDVLAPPGKQRTKNQEAKTSSQPSQQSPIDVTTEDIIPRLTPENVSDLVLVSMVMLPEAMPASFQATYTPIAAAGTPAQIKHMARLIANQLHAVGLGKGAEMASKKEEESAMDDKEDDDEEEDVSTSPKHTIQTLVGGYTATAATDANQESETKMPSISSTQTRKGIKKFKLASVTKTMNSTLREEFALASFDRILAAEKTCCVGNGSAVRAKVLSSLASVMGTKFKDALQAHIFADLRNRSDLAFNWLYQEYSQCQGHLVQTVNVSGQSMDSYDECLTRLLSGLLARPDQREGLFSRLLLEAPLITPRAIHVLKQYCQDETRIYLGMSTLKELILKRPNHKAELLRVLLDFGAHDVTEVRNNAMRMIKSLHDREDMELYIEGHAQSLLKYLLLPSPPPELFHMEATDIPDAWSEESIKMCLYLYLGLMPIKHRLIHELAAIYTSTSADVKRIILRILEAPVKGMGMDSPELLLLVENCPKGAETLITRIIHILTDKAVPSPELVDRVKDLYHKRVADVRFLIPVLNGLAEKEVIAALPRLIKLNPNVVKEVFNRLLGGHGDASSAYSSPLNPAQLLVALHNIDPLKCDMKTIIKATNLCFAEKTIYTQEVLALVMQQLMEQRPLPTLLMRTVIQALAMYPRLIGFVMNILQRLIIKEVWKEKKVWEGFIKCCQRTKPQSFQVLLQLPAAQLPGVFEICPELKDPLYQHVQTLLPNQRAHIPKSVMAVLEDKSTAGGNEADKPLSVAEIENIQPKGITTLPRQIPSTYLTQKVPTVSPSQSPQVNTAHPAVPQMDTTPRTVPLADKVPQTSPGVGLQISTIGTLQPAASPTLKTIQTISTIGTRQSTPPSLAQPVPAVENVNIAPVSEAKSAQHNLAVRPIQQVPVRSQSISLVKSGQSSGKSVPAQLDSDSNLEGAPAGSESQVADSKGMDVSESSPVSIKETEEEEPMEVSQPSDKQNVELVPTVARGRRKAAPAAGTPSTTVERRSTRSSKK